MKAPLVLPDENPGDEVRARLEFKQRKRGRSNQSSIGARDQFMSGSALVIVSL
jgi:hypothetical protein